MPRNPNWTRDELILALDLYFQFDRIPSSKNPEVLTLSDTLNLLPIHKTDNKNQKFRNPEGVHMKLCNFLRFDPNYPGKGLDAGSKLDEIVWNDFSGNKTLLRRIANAIKETYILHPNKLLEDPVNLSDDEEFLEGKLLTRLHKTRERNSLLTKRKKDYVLQNSGSLECEVCGFDFQKKYGELGYGFAECHHLISVSEFDQVRKSRIDDLAIVCANCHRMLHRSKPMLSIQELARLIQ